MKKNKKALIILLMLISLFSVCQIKRVNADSGFDSSYSSSSSSSSSSHSSSDSDYSSGSGGSLSDLTEEDVVIIIIIFICIVVYYFIIYPILMRIDRKFDKFIDKRLDKIKKNKLLKYKEISPDVLASYFNLSLDRLKEILYNDFVDIQKAWMDFDYDTLKKLCDNNIYNTYYEELEALKLKGNKNIMLNFIKVEDKIVGIKQENSIVTVSYYLDVKFYDYIVSKNGIIVKGNDKTVMNNVYILEFSINKDETVNKCPNCGADIETGTYECKFCKAVIVQDSNKFVMSSKRKIN